MAELFKIMRNDTKPYLAVTIASENGSAVDLSNGSVYFNMATDDNLFAPVFSGACNITGSVAGECEYRWFSGTGNIDTNRSGTYLGEFEVVYNDGTSLTVPPDHTLKVKISEDYDS